MIQTGLNDRLDGGREKVQTGWKVDHVINIMNGCVDGWMDGQMDGWMDGQMDGWMTGKKHRF